MSEYVTTRILGKGMELAVVMQALTGEYQYNAVNGVCI